MRKLRAQTHPPRTGEKLASTSGEYVLNDARVFPLTSLTPQFMFMCSEAPGRRSNNLQDVDTVEETWGQHQETQSEVEAREAEELRLAEEEHAAQELISSQVRPFRRSDCN